MASAEADSSDALPDEEPAMERPPEIGVDERRMHVRAYNYWVSLLNGRSYPSIQDVDPHTIDDFGPHSVLLDLSRDAGAPEKSDNGALDRAAAAGEAATVRALRAAGAAVKAVNAAGRTGLMMAAANGHLAAVRALLGRGADGKLKDQAGATALANARGAGHQAIAALIEAAGSKGKKK